MDIEYFHIFIFFIITINSFISVFMHISLISRIVFWDMSYIAQIKAGVNFSQFQQSVMFKWCDPNIILKAVQSNIDFY